jgi:hypothetical protein
MPTKFAKWRPVRRDAIPLLNVEAQFAHEIDALLPDVGMLGCHLKVPLDIRENAVSPNGLDMDMRLRGAGLSPLMFAYEHGLDSRIGHRAPHYLSGDPEHVIAVLCRYGSGPHEVTQIRRVWQEVAPVFNNDV